MVRGSRVLPFVRLFPAAALGLALCGCNYEYFYKQDLHATSFGLVDSAEVTFGPHLPDALDEVFATCLDPLVISPTVTDPAGTCDALTDVTSTGAVNVLAGLLVAPDIDLSAAFPSNLTTLLNSPFVVGLNFPFQNCVISIVPAMTVSGLSLAATHPTWTTHDSKPALLIHFDAADPTFASGPINSYIGNCSSPISAGLLTATVLPALPSGPHDINLDDLTLDLWFTFAGSGTDVTVAVAAQLGASAIKLSPPLSSTAQSYVGTFQHAFETYSGETLEQMLADVDSSIEASLGDISGQLEALVEHAVPAGQRICSLSMLNGKLTMETFVVCPISMPR